MSRGLTLQERAASASASGVSVRSTDPSLVIIIAHFLASYLCKRPPRRRWNGMGARESTARNPQEAAEAGPPNYYTLLEVDEDATADEIKVSMPVFK